MVPIVIVVEAIFVGVGAVGRCVGVAVPLPAAVLVLKVSCPRAQVFVVGRCVGLARVCRR